MRRHILLGVLAVLVIVCATGYGLYKHEKKVQADKNATAQELILEQSSQVNTPRAMDCTQTPAEKAMNEPAFGCKSGANEMACTLDRTLLLEEQSTNGHATDVQYTNYTAQFNEHKCDGLLLPQ